MRRLRIVRFCLLSSVAAAALATFSQFSRAHHSVFANFDTSRTIEISGTVLSADIRNPHSQFVLEVMPESGGREEWLVEWSDRNSLIRRKVAFDRIKVGDDARIVIWPSRQLNNAGYFVQAIMPDGSIFRDCGFREFREAVVNSQEFSCEDAGGAQ